MLKRRMSVIALVVVALAVATTAAGAAGRPLATELSGANEVPNPGDPDGWGHAVVTLNLGQGEVCWEIHVADITLPATAAHIHAAPAGVPGSVVVPLSAPDASGHASGCTTGVDHDLILDILRDPSGYYVNVHNADYPAGALRGQLGR